MNALNDLAFFFTPLHNSKTDFIQTSYYIATALQVVHVVAMIIFTSTPPAVIAQFALNGVMFLIAAETKIPILLLLPFGTSIWAAASIHSYSMALIPIVIF